MPFGFATTSGAEPLLTQGIGTQNCGKLAADLKPSEGLNHPPNYLLFYWEQGYVSAANIYLLNEYTDYVDMNDVEVKVILDLVYAFCKANRTTSRSPRLTSSSARQKRSTPRNQTR